jgi:hypothetical protein
MSPNDDDSGRACAQNGIKRMFNIFRNDATLSLCMYIETFTKTVAIKNIEREKKRKKNDDILIDNTLTFRF